MVKSTPFVPKGTRIVEETWSVISGKRLFFVNISSDLLISIRLRKQFWR